MNFAFSSAIVPDSPISSGRNSPVPRLSRQVIQEEALKTDKALRRYAANLERALATWETAPEDWADYIAFLNRLSKTIQAHPKDVSLLPHSTSIASKLAQCLSPSLPSGVHQKALEVYQSIFELLGNDRLSAHLSEFLPGLSGVLTFASLSIRPTLYALYEDHILRVEQTHLRPALRSLVLSLLPPLEDETSEDFERAFSILLALERKFDTARDLTVEAAVDQKGYFWQCIFLAVVSSPSRRQGALSFLNQRLPSFVPSTRGHAAVNGAVENDSSESLSRDADVLVTPDPGLLIRCFVCGLSDSQLLVQRGYLDLLISHLPLHSPVMQHRASKRDVDRIVFATATILLRRDVSLNRRLWAWFLGPNSGNTAGVSAPATPDESRRPSLPSQQPSQLLYFKKYGLAPLASCLLLAFNGNSRLPSGRPQPFRICVSLMDRWEIGGTLVPSILLPALKSVYCCDASASDQTDLIKHANLFFDGVESKIIWANLFVLLRSATSATASAIEDLKFFRWIIRHFNLQDDEMLTSHLPIAVLYLAAAAIPDRSAAPEAVPTEDLLEVARSMLELLPERALTQNSPQEMTSGLSSDVTRESPASLGARHVMEEISTLYRNTSSDKFEQQTQDIISTKTLIDYLGLIAARSVAARESAIFKSSASMLIGLLSKTRVAGTTVMAIVLPAISESLSAHTAEDVATGFTDLSLSVSMAHELHRGSFVDESSRPAMIELAEIMTKQIWRYLSPQNPQHHVEGVKLLWQVDDLVKDSDSMQVWLSILMRSDWETNSLSPVDSLEAVRRFTVLWTHSITQRHKSSNGPRSSLRKSSSVWSLNDATKSLRQKQVLWNPLLICLDVLGGREDPNVDFVKHWLRNLPGLDAILDALLDKIQSLTEPVLPSSVNPQRSQRLDRQRLREIDYFLHRLQDLLTEVPDAFWAALDSLEVQGTEPGLNQPATLALAKCAADLLASPSSSPSIAMICVSLLSRFLSGPLAADLRPLELDTRFIDQVINCVESPDATLQSHLLHLIEASLRVRLNIQEDMESSRSHVVSTRERTSGQLAQSAANGSIGFNVLTANPPGRLFTCIKAGFSSPAARFQMDRWLEFLRTVLSMFSNAIFLNLIPLVDCFCNQLRGCFQELVAMSAKIGAPFGPLLDSSISGLFQALEVVLSRAHECLLEENERNAPAKSPEPSSGFFGNATAAKFRSSGPPSQTTHANSRLTVLLTFHDTVRVCFAMWTWASQNTDLSLRQTSNALTTAYHALKIRNRSRHLLEEVFGAEPLECLEVVIYNWCHAKPGDGADAAVRLLNILSYTRPKSAVPAILDAICSRSYPAALSADRLSSLTVDLSASEITLFLQAYFESVEDDAMDEIWPDCVVFLRDVLSNPMPYRQILIPLLTILITMTRKLDNTNFGEQRKMRRELADLFQRTMSAIHSLSSAGSFSQPMTQDGDAFPETMVQTLEREGATNVVIVLSNAIDHFESIIDSQERVSTSLGSICTNIVSPRIHAKDFPANIDQGILNLLLRIAKKAPTAKHWRKEVLDAFSDGRFFSAPAQFAQDHWFPVLHQWAMHDRERMEDFISRLLPPSSAGIMFGVGASAARLEADRKAQLNLRRICTLLLAAPTNMYAAHIKGIGVKLVELFDASFSSSPSCVINAELFMLCRALVLSTDAVHVFSLWPLINEQLQRALTGILSEAGQASAFTNLSLLQACKLLDLLLILSPDDFQPFEWLYITDTSDAVYQPTDWRPQALTDQVSEALAASGEPGDATMAVISPSVGVAHEGLKRPMIRDVVSIDSQDVKAMGREDFAKTVLRPFISQFSIQSYEAMYSMGAPDTEACRRSLVADIFDVSTMVE